MASKEKEGLTPRSEHWAIEREFLLKKNGQGPAEKERPLGFFYSGDAHIEFIGYASRKLPE